MFRFAFIASVAISVGLAAVVDLAVVEGDQSACPDQYSKVPTTGTLNGDMNQDATRNGAHPPSIWLCAKSSSTEQPITDIAVISSLFSHSGCGSLDTDWSRISQSEGSNGDFNQGAGGKYIYICQRKVQGRRALTELNLHEDKCEEGMFPIQESGNSNGDFNQGAGGKYIYLCAKRSPASARPALRFDGNTFRIAAFCDMHFGENAGHDTNSVAFQNKILDLEKPNLVVIDGDASSNYAAPSCGDGLPCQNYYTNNFAKFTAPMESRGVPYAYALGNHDRIPGKQGTVGGNESSYYVSDHWIMQYDHEMNDNAVSSDGPRDISGASNYVLPVLGPDNKSAFYVWIFDSSDNNCQNVSGWGCVYPDQVKWYREKSAKLIEQDGRVVPGLAFFHIPLPEVNDAWNSGKAVGSRKEAVCSFSVNTGMFAAMKEVGNIVGAFHGHDHNNDFYAKYQGIAIGYGRKSGYGGYGGAIARYPGSRVFEMTLNGTEVSWETWIRLEGGDKCIQTSQHQTCNPTGLLHMPSVSPYEEQLAKAAHICRTKDDRQSCRVASGMESPWEDYEAEIALV